MRPVLQFAIKNFRNNNLKKKDFWDPLPLNTNSMKYKKNYIWTVGL